MARQQQQNDHEGKTTNGQPQAPEPKEASPSRRRKRTVTRDGGINDPDLYARMAAPYATADEANTALAAFLRAVRALRLKHRIADVVTVAVVYVTDCGPMITYRQNGSEEMTPLILAWALGKEEAAAKAKVGAAIATMRARGGATDSLAGAPVPAVDRSRSSPNTPTDA